MSSALRLTGSRWWLRAGGVCSSSCRGARPRRACPEPRERIEAENCLPGNPPSEWDITGAGDAGAAGLRDRHQRGPGRDGLVQGEQHERHRVPDRHLPPGLLPGQRRAVHHDDPERVDHEDEPARLPPRHGRRACKTAATGRCPRRGPCRRGRPPGSTSRSSCARTGRKVPATWSSSCGTTTGDRSFCSRRRTPRGRPTTGGGQQPLHGRRSWWGRGAGARVQGQLQPAVQHGRGDAGGLAVPRRVPDGAVAGAERLRRQLLHGGRHRPAWQRDPGARGLPLGGARRVLVGAAAGERRGGSRPHDPGPPRVLQQQRDLLEDAVGDEQRRGEHAVPHARLLQGDARRRQDRPGGRRVDGDLARPAADQPRGAQA